MQREEEARRSLRCGCCDIWLPGSVPERWRALLPRFRETSSRFFSSLQLKSASTEQVLLRLTERHPYQHIQLGKGPQNNQELHPHRRLKETAARTTPSPPISHHADSNRPCKANSTPEIHPPANPAHPRSAETAHARAHLTARASSKNLLPCDQIEQNQRRQIIYKSQPLLNQLSWLDRQHASHSRNEARTRRYSQLPRPRNRRSSRSSSCRSADFC